VILQNPELSQYLNANTQTYNFTEGVEWWRRAVVAAAPQLTNESAELLIIYLSEMNWSDDDDMWNDLEPEESSVLDMVSLNENEEEYAGIERNEARIEADTGTNED
jgi:hypothetical protein